MVDDFYGDSALFRLVEGAGGVAVEGFPGFLVDFGLEGGFEGTVGVVGAEEVSAKAAVMPAVILLQARSANCGYMSRAG